MKNIFKILALVITMHSYAQYDLAAFAADDSQNISFNSTSSSVFFSASVTSAPNMYTNDTLYFPCTVSSITPASGETNSTDTLELDISVQSHWATESPTITVSNRLNSYTFNNVGDLVHSVGTYRFVEGEVDTLKVVVNSSILAFHGIILQKTTSSVILNSSKDLLTSQATISNPVENGLLSIDLNDAVAELELLNMQGEIVKSFAVNGKGTFSVSDLTAGIYVLRDTQGVSFRKIMIK